MGTMRRALERLRAVRHIEWALLALLAAAALMLLSGASSDGTTQSGGLERRMEAVLECVQGAGRVRVLVNGSENTDPFSGHADRSVVGVLVVAEGADDLNVALALGRAVQTLLGVESDQIEILDMQENSP